MENTRVLSQRELSGKSRCNVLRKTDLQFSEKENVNYKKIITIKQIIKDNLIQRKSDEEIRNEIIEIFKELKFQTETTRNIHATEAFNEVKRYLDSEAQRKRNICFLPSKIIDVYGTSVKVTPDIAFVNNNTIEIVKFCVRRPDVTQNGDKLDASVNNCLELYAMLCYAKEFVKNGYKVNLKASFYYLRKTTDSLKKHVFDWDFFEGGGNVVTLEIPEYQKPSDCYIYDEEDRDCEYCIYQYCCGNKNFSNKVDVMFYQQMKNFQKGEENCNSETCKVCDMNHICNYTHAPKIMKKVKKVKKITEIKLTPNQEKAIDFDKGLCRINAGAGAGKTLVVALRVIRLLMKGVKPEDICLLTFTNVGAGEMKERIEAYNKDFDACEDISGLTSTTFNAFGDKVVKNEYISLGYDRCPTLIDDVERSCIIADLLRVNEIKGLDYRNFGMNAKYCKGALAITKKCFDIIKKNKLSRGDASTLYATLGTDRMFVPQSSLEDMIILYETYDNILREECLIEFADQELLVFEMLKKDPFYFENFKFKHIIIDEFQDTSKEQIEMVKALIDTPSFESLMVVGDDSQAIYGFRGTTPEYIVNFFDVLGRTGTDFYLLDNHRSTPEIIEFANKINDLNIDKVAKSLVSNRPHGKGVIVRGFATSADEYTYILDKIMEKLEDGEAPENIAFIASDKFELMKMGSLLKEKGIPSVLLNPELLIENSRVIAAIELVKFIKDQTATKSAYIYINCLKGGTFLSMTKKEINEEVDKLTTTVKTLMALPENAKVNMFHSLLEELDEDDEVYESFMDTLKNKACVSKQFEYCENFEEYGSAQSIRRVRDYPGIVLTTAHSSKGLEWNIVFNSISKYDNKDLRGNKVIEEKRRLLFVSATRARDELYISGTYVAYTDKEYGDSYNRFLINCYNVAGLEFVPDKPVKEKKEKKEKK